MRTRPLLMIMLAGCIAMTGCGKKTQDQNAGENTGAGNRVEISTDQGTLQATSGNGITIPADFPKDIFLYPGAKPVTSMTMPRGHVLTLESSDPLHKVADAYQKNMPSAGWKQEMAMESGDSRIYAYSKGTQQVQLSIGSDSNSATTISITESGGQ